MKYFLLLAAGLGWAWASQSETPAPSSAPAPAPEPRSLPPEAEPSPTAPVVPSKKTEGQGFPIKIGSRGPLVVALQRKLNLPPDGTFGPQTQKYLEKATGLTELNQTQYRGFVAKDNLKKKLPSTENTPQIAIKAADVHAVFNAIYKIMKPQGHAWNSPQQLAARAVPKMDVDSDTVYRILYGKPKEYLREFQKVYNTSRQSPNVIYKKQGLVAAVGEISTFSNGYSRRDWIIDTLKSL